MTNDETINLDGMDMKFLVIKVSDLNYLSLLHCEALGVILGTISKKREKDNKKNNKYLVINTDEPYADQVINIMKENGHWG